jgi:hypothetical protein
MVVAPDFTNQPTDGFLLNLSRNSEQTLVHGGGTRFHQPTDGFLLNLSRNPEQTFE